MIELIEVLHLKLLAHGYADRHLPGRSIHGKYIADVHHCSLISQMPHIYICKVEMHTLHQHVGSHQNLLVWIMQNGTVIAHAVLSGIIFSFYIVREPVYKSELTKFGNFHL